ncbi:hypothetical protein BDW74DRAFT_156484, partial [Aspergillus multicolor]|uniref:uncharacterized protein n=1 Tax=Aspergillus multicolor TaxID=41759 RepID=UPI003CCD736B
TGHDKNLYPWKRGNDMNWDFSLGWASPGWICCYATDAFRIILICSPGMLYCYD